MTRALVVLTAVLLLKASPAAVVEQIENKQSPVSESKLKAGDLVRINRLDMGVPGSLGIFPTIEQAKRTVQAVTADTEARRIYSTESLLFIGHNTPATIDQIDSFSVGGKKWRFALVTLGASPLRGQKFWVNLAQLRGANEPDLALKTFPEAKKLSGLLKSIDPEYEPKAGDEVILGFVVVSAAPEDESRDGKG